MHTNRFRALSRIHRAVQAGMPVFRTDGGDPGAGGAGGGEKPTKEKPADDGKLSLTADELQAKIDAALATAQKKADDKAAKDKADAERKAAEEQGQFQKIADTEKARADAAEAQVKALKLASDLRAHIDTTKPELAKAAPLIAKLIDANDPDTAKAIKAAVAEYEGSLPTKPKGGTPEPLPRTGNRGIAAGAGGRKENERSTRRYSSLMRRV